MMETLFTFDLDDTLVPEVLFLKSGIRHIAKTISERFPIITQFRIINRMDAAVMARQNHYSALETLLEEYGILSEIDMEEIVAEFRCHKPDPEIYHPAPSILLALENLRNQGIPLALITDGRSITQRNKINAAGLMSFFSDSDIIISEETGHDKKDPDNFLFIMKKYAGIKNFIYVADNPPKDFIQPQKLGWGTHLDHPFPLAIHQGIPR